MSTYLYRCSRIYAFQLTFFSYFHDIYSQYICKTRSGLPTTRDNLKFHLLFQVVYVLRLLPCAYTLRLNRTDPFGRFHSHYYIFSGKDKHASLFLLDRPKSVFFSVQVISLKYDLSFLLFKRLTDSLKGTQLLLRIDHHGRTPTMVRVALLMDERIIST